MNNPTHIPSGIIPPDLPLAVPSASPALGEETAQLSRSNPSSSRSAERRSLSLNSLAKEARSECSGDGLARKFAVSSTPSARSNPAPDLDGGGKLLPLVEDFYTLQGEGAHTGRAAYFIRLGGCDVGCSWCDAKETWNAKTHPPVAAEEIVRRAAKYPAKAVVITGGEPLMYPLDHLTGLLHEAGIAVFLETSGSHPFSGSFDWVCLSPKRKQPPLSEAWSRAHELKVIVETPEDLAWAEHCAALIEAAIPAREVEAAELSSSKSEPSRSAEGRSLSLNSLAKEARPQCSGDDLARKSAASSVLSASGEIPPAQAPRPLAVSFVSNVQLFLQPEWSRRHEIMPVIVEYIKQNPRWRVSLQSHKYMRIP